MFCVRVRYLMTYRFAVASPGPCHTLCEGEALRFGELYFLRMVYDASLFTGSTL